jgi:hypothetical protein
VADRDGVYGMVRAHVKARELGVQLIPGATLTIAAAGAALVPSPVGAPRPAGLHATAEDDGADAAMSLARRGRTRRAPRKRAAVDADHRRAVRPGDAGADRRADVDRRARRRSRRLAQPDPADHRRPAPRAQGHRAPRVGRAGRPRRAG